ncbi:phosphatase PAP2 family protein [Nocardioides sp. Kera G14]|uniref:phosphatase PAP2 family protein n=1 Tax=Nocardioides sp. Kera G14 TaxID=2884264 RepID=UPI001D0FA96B|nr:phosphatase PAP2 family protein [Nocardioides sp. Kera G14]UDY22759.1 phosphatase PAP2 family protein [Nocardioides sp. Kera G14]
MNITRVLPQTARQWGLAWACSLILVVVMLVMSATTNVPLRDPDNVLPGYIRFPLIVVGVLAVDVLPRWILRMSRDRVGPVDSFKGVMRDRWPASHWWFAANGVVSWYVCYAAFRNVKSMAPIANPGLWDDRLAHLDRFFLGGHDPADVLHSMLGQGWAAHLLSDVYFLWIAMVPVSIAVALVWTRFTSAGAWFVTAVSVDWLLGALLYYVIPTVGPIYSDPKTFAHLPHTYVTELASSMWDDRVKVLADPTTYDGLQTIAAFPSLHVGIMVTITLTVVLIRVPRIVRIAAYVMLVLTILATVYLGWHFGADVIGGALLGAFAVWAAAMATGNHEGWRPALRPQEAQELDELASSALTTRP